MHLLKDPFRSFFILTALIGIFVPMYFVGILVNDYSINEDLISSFSWHGHEMVFGFTSALITGFLLTASAKWTGKKTVSQIELVVSILIWITSRLVLLYQPSETLILILGPLPFIYILFKMIFILKGQKNLIPVTGVISIFLASNYLHLHSSINSNQDLVDMSYKIASIAVFVLLYIFSGKLITFFTNNKFKSSEVKLIPKEEIVVLLICITALLSNIFFFTKLEQVLSIICAALLLRRSLRLVHKDSIKDPMLLVLNAGHLFFPIYFLLRFLQFFNEQAIVGRADLHSLFAGGLGLISLGMITRVSLGHTGRQVVASKWMIFAFTSTFIGAILRVFHPIYLGDAINFWLHTSMGFWTLGFIIYLFNFRRLLFKPRL